MLKKIKKYSGFFLIAFIIILFCYFLYNNIIKPISIQEINNYTIQFDDFTYNYVSTQLEEKNDGSIYYTSLKSLPTENTNDYISISIFIKVENKSFFDVNGIYANVLGINREDLVLLQDYLLFTESINSFSEDELLVASLIINRKAVGDEELKEYIRSLELEVCYSYKLGADKTYTISMEECDFDN